MTKIVNITGVPGRVAFTRATGGSQIPHDAVIPVVLTPWIDSRIDAGDIALVEEDDKKKKTSAAAAKAKEGVE
jgi:hypothetical protein